MALQINNWNEDRQATIEEHNIYRNLNTEFKVNKTLLQSDLLLNEGSMASGKIIMDLIGSDESYLKTKNIDSILYQLFEMGSVSFSENTVLEIIQSGKMKYIKNDTIKNLIFEWTQNKEFVERSLENRERVSNLLLAYIYKTYPLKNIDMYGRLKWQSPSKLSIDKFAIFKAVEFESLIDDLLYNYQGFIARQKSLETIIDRIIQASEPYAHKNMTSDDQTI
ncbi:hypothetical protein GCM10022260_07790 [Gaetbulibacter aestuarii]